MAVLTDFLKIFLPAILVLYGVYLTVKAFLSKEFELKVADIKSRHVENTLQLRLLAYERMVIYLERITPGNLLLRLNVSNVDMSAGEIQLVMVNEIREEFSHNLSQQIYMSEAAWSAIRQATEEVIALINQSVQLAGREVPAPVFARALMQVLLDTQYQPTEKALLAIKQEVRELF